MSDHLLGEYRPDDELQRLLLLWSEDCLEQADVESLDNILTNDSQAREFFHSFVNVNSLLQWQFAPPMESGEIELAQSHAKDQRLLGNALVVITPSVDVKKTNSSLVAKQSRKRFYTQPNIISIMVAIVVVFSGLFLLQQIYLANLENTDHNEQIVKANVNTKVAAKISKLMDCHWAEGSQAKVEGAELHNGDILDIQHGAVIIEFNSTAVVQLEGPVRFRLDAADHGTLFTGNLSAYVPEKARGFTVDTPEARTIDLGTQFKLLASANEGTYIEVSKGTVEVTPMTEDKILAEEKWIIEAGRALFVSSKGNSTSYIPATRKSLNKVGTSVRVASNFDSDVESWKVEGDGSGPTHRASKGISNGYIFTVDGRKSKVARFVAPKKFHGDLSDAIDGTLSFDLLVYLSDKSSNLPKKDTENLVIIRGKDIDIAYPLSHLPRHGYWHQHSIRFSPDSNWVVLGKKEERLATRKDIAKALRSIRKLKILGEFYSGVEYEECRLDNVMIKTVKKNRKSNEN